MTKGRIRAVGIDFEKRIADKTRTQITDQILHGSEHQVLANHTGDLNTIFTLIFSAKESFFKAAHDEVQRYFGFEALKLVSIDPQNQILHFEIQETLSASYVSGMAVQVYYQLIDDKSVATLCYF